MYETSNGFPDSTDRQPSEKKEMETAPKGTWVGCLGLGHGLAEAMGHALAEAIHHGLESDR